MFTEKKAKTIRSVQKNTAGEATRSHSDSTTRHSALFLRPLLSVSVSQSMCTLSLCTPSLCALCISVESDGGVGCEVAMIALRLYPQLASKQLEEKESIDDTTDSYLLSANNQPPIRC